MQQRRKRRNNNTNKKNCIFFVAFHYQNTFILPGPSLEFVCSFFFHFIFCFLCTSTNPIYQFILLLVTTFSEKLQVSFLTIGWLRETHGNIQWKIDDATVFNKYIYFWTYFLVLLVTEVKGVREWEKKKKSTDPNNGRQFIDLFTNILHSHLLYWKTNHHHPLSQGATKGN